MTMPGARTTGNRTSLRSSCPSRARRAATLLCLGLAAFLLVAVAESATGLDMAVQRLLLTAEGGWPVDKALHARWGWLLYTGPKVLLGALGGAALLVACASFVSRWQTRLNRWRGPCLVLAGTLALGVLLVAILKHYSGVG